MMRRTYILIYILMLSSCKDDTKFQCFSKLNFYFDNGNKMAMGMRIESGKATIWTGLSIKTYKRVVMETDDIKKIDSRVCIVLRSDLKHLYTDSAQDGQTAIFYIDNQKYYVHGYSGPRELLDFSNDLVMFIEREFNSSNNAFGRPGITGTNVSPVACAYGNAAPYCHFLGGRRKGQ